MSLFYRRRDGQTVALTDNAELRFEQTIVGLSHRWLCCAPNPVTSLAQYRFPPRRENERCQIVRVKLTTKY